MKIKDKSFGTWDLKENIARMCNKFTIQRGEQIKQDMRRITKMFWISWKSLNAMENNMDKIENRKKGIQEERITEQVLNIED